MCVIVDLCFSSEAVEYFFVRKTCVPVLIVGYSVFFSWVTHTPTFSSVFDCARFGKP